MLDPSAFVYDQQAPFDIAVVSESHRDDGTTIQDITYASPRRGAVPAYLIVPSPGPSQQAPAAGVIFGHWGEGNRSEFVEEAVLLARLGFIALCPDAPFVRPTEREPALSEMAQGDAQWVVDVRRGVDLLIDRFHLPAGRLGYVGHSYSATFGGVVTGIERRIAAYVLMAGDPALSEWMRTTTHPALVQQRQMTPPREYRAYLEALAPLDASHYIGHAAPSHLFFQFARHDEYVAAERAERYFALASEPKRVAWYECTHAFNGQARRERATFLCERLGLAPPSPHLLHLLEQAPVPTPRAPRADVQTQEPMA
jgi:dienelactone hydrolase